MNNLRIILRDDYAVIILSIISYIFFRVISRIKYKKRVCINIIYYISLNII